MVRWGGAGEGGERRADWEMKVFREEEEGGVSESWENTIKLGGFFVGGSFSPSLALLRYLDRSFDAGCEPASLENLRKRKKISLFERRIGAKYLGSGYGFPVGLLSVEGSAKGQRTACAGDTDQPEQG
jgi:hypothetical protein